ncbi:MAG TPA: bifunctional histidinol-phosphatase/imidazoleglycerol-phosphate dehydratase HisB [Xanthomonadaceae bacterium]|jgi:imidazoleglycerol-phosphate dehydratase/histidinol-phosphatase|nr:bifunctional histidinol-phosphatase/imidazoleglycerol-phosphate dehydratase HisB [Xanthomonadaceae bacterium]
MSARRILFVDRDGTLITEPPDEQIDACEKLRLIDGAIPALLRLREAGFDFVLVSNQDGLGTASFPQESFDGPHRLLLQILASVGIVFREELIDSSFAHENRMQGGVPTRKPGIGLAMHYLRDRGVDLTRSAMVGDRQSDLEFARNLGVRGFLLAPDGEDWKAIADALCAGERSAQVERVTRETRVRVAIDLDREADPVVATGHGFFDHMLEQLGKHGGFALSVTCAGDLHIDEHHTVEDCALAIGQALREALGDKRGIARYGSSPPRVVETGDQGPCAAVVLPMDESLAEAALDLSGRAYFVFDGSFPRTEVGGLATELVPHFFRSLCDAGGINLHLRVRGENTHHMVEACFKAVARALRVATRRDGCALASTKGTL